MQGETKQDPDPLDLENYYEALAPFTFATQFIPLSRATGERL